MVSKSLFSFNSLRWLERILLDRFGHEFELTEVQSELILRIPDKDLEVRIGYLQTSFHDSSSKLDCFVWKPSESGLEGAICDELFAPSEVVLPTKLIDFGGEGAHIHYDILGLTYWMLTRQEEVACKKLDSHQRFPASSSHAYQHGYLDRPIVDEWLDILGQVIVRVWPDLNLKQHKFQVQVSHDVDEPSKYAFKSFKGLARIVAGQCLKNRDYKAAVIGPKVWLNSRKRIDRQDPVNTFDWLMDQSDKNGLKSAFYFICGRTDKEKDALYDVEMPQIRELIKHIHKRGHEVGLHPSYNTYDSPTEIAREANRLFQVCKEEGVTQAMWGGRMHYLRWNSQVTPAAWESAGMNYDASLGYADRPGFRCGTCFEYPWFDTSLDKELSLTIRPLIAMDCTVIAERYLALGSTEAAYEKFNELKVNCLKVNGTFSLLWHNSFFKSQEDFDIYQRLIQ
ncbi:polysaccharide deacetylase family protein [Idiomarina abyssalis]|uniref:polysaccharide deacetylase family protein n=1 Tax=Idiomarina abyssalis TaxID=86102 RepID=UPI002301B793|nr:polysaccharide deacetylase family protein [Idiomarina abyssalis]MDA6067158.1 polysaccharide deacetylase family protein [Idiomarina abyssalis]